MSKPLDIVIFGLALFDTLPGRYRVLFPDGRDPFTGPYPIPVHEAALWVRPRNVFASHQWQWSFSNNDFRIDAPSELVITGLLPATFETFEFDDRMMHIRRSDIAYELASDPEAILETIIHQGRLTVHEYGSGMLIVRWEVERDDVIPVRFQCGTSWIDVPPDAQQVIIANAGRADQGVGDGVAHFLLYRKLATVKAGPLAPVRPSIMPAPMSFDVITPSHGYPPRTPLIDCSAVVKP